MIIHGDCLTVMREMDPEQFQTCVTSPPYWGLRDYGIPPSEWPPVSFSPMPGLSEIHIPEWTGCLGLEPTPEMFVGHIVLVFREVYRVLRSDGTLWLNFGDSYCSTAPASWGDPLLKRGPLERVSVQAANARKRYRPETPNGLKPKDLVGMPWRVAFALQADGWYLRMDNVWNKPNPMPESVKDRTTKAHEYLFLLSKSERYYYDAEAIREPAVGTNMLPPAGSEGAFGPQQSRRRNGSGNKERKYGEERGRPGSHIGGSIPWEGVSRNKRSVWTIATEAFPQAHFATFPKKLVEPCIQAGSSPQACPHCGSPWERRVVATGGSIGRSWNDHEHDSIKGQRATERAAKGGSGYTRSTVGWEPTCSCENNDGSGKCKVLDPFGGSGTTQLVALENDRDCTIIEIGKQYVEMAEQRTAVVQPKLQLS